MPDRERVIMLTEADAQSLLHKLQRLYSHDSRMAAIPVSQGEYLLRSREARSTFELRENIEKQIVDAVKHDAKIARRNQMMRRLAEVNSIS